MRGPTIRSAAVIGAVLVSAVGLTGCGGSDGDITTGTSKSNDPRSGGQSGFDVTTVAPPAGQDGPLGTAIGEPSDSRPTVPTTAPVPAEPGAALLSAVAAYQAALGTPAIRTLEFMIQFPQGQTSYGSLQSQDPAIPANIDERPWRNGAVGDAQPVQLTGDPADLEANLFSLDQIDWTAISTALGGAQAAVEAKVGPLSGTKGITHLIATSDLPFSENVVVRVYVDGGDRRPGGYVQYLANGTLDKVQA